MTFNALHNQKGPLILCNVWDAASAQLAQQVGFQAIGTSSAAIASTLGKEDGENISFDDLLSVVTQIMNVSALPLTVDIESGYGNNVGTIVENIGKLANLGVVGVNIEDSEVLQRQRTLNDSTEFSNKLNSIKEALLHNSIDMFINVRTDAFMVELEGALKITLERIKQYQNAGADGVFVPGVKDRSDISSLVSATHLPLNVMCVPELPDFKTLTNLGVKRISMGNFIYESAQNKVSRLLHAINEEQCFNPVFR